MCPLQSLAFFVDTDRTGCAKSQRAERVGVAERDGPPGRGRATTLCKVPPARAVAPTFRRRFARAQATRQNPPARTPAPPARTCAPVGMDRFLARAVSSLAIGLY